MINTILKKDSTTLAFQATKRIPMIKPNSTQTMNVMHTTKSGAARTGIKAMGMAFMLCLMAVFAHAQLATWTLTSSNTPVTCGFSTTGPTAGTGVTSVTSTDATTGYSGTGFSTSSAAAQYAYTITKYFQFTVTNTGSTSVTIATLNLNAYYNGSISMDYAIRYSTDAFATSANSPLLTSGNVVNPATVTAGSFSPNVTLAAGATLTFRVYGYYSDATTYRFGLTSFGIIATPAVPTAVTATANGTTQIDLSATANAAANNILVLTNTTNTFGTPVPGTSYTVGNTVTGGGTVIYKGAAGSPYYSNTGLASGTTYYYKVFSVNTCNTYSAGVAANATTVATACTSPTAQPTTLTFPTVAATSLTGSFVAASPVPTGYTVFRSTSATAPVPIDGTPYTAGTAYTFSGNSYTAVANASNSFSETSLTANTLYYYYIFATNSGSCSGGPKYLATSPLSGSVTTCLATPATLTGVAAGTSSATITFGTVTGAASYVLQYRVNGTTPWFTASPAPTATPYTLTGLAANTAYDIQIEGTNGSACTNFKTTTNAFTTSPNPLQYNFAQAIGTYTPITAAGGATSAAGATFDDEVVTVTLTTPFTYNGTSYTQMNISGNGYITLGSVLPGATDYLPLSTTSYSYNAAIAPFGRDLNYSAVSGSAPSILYQYVSATNEWVVQWTDAGRYASTGSADRISFQIRLNTSTGNIQFVYGGTITTGALTSTFQVGLRGANTTYPTQVINRANNVTTSVAAALGWDKSTYGASNTDAMTWTNAASTPAAGLTYTFTPNSCTPFPVPAAATSLTTSGATANWAAVAGASNGYLVRYRALTDALTVSTWATPTAVASGTTNLPITGLNAATTYIFEVASSCSAGSNSIFSNGITFTTVANPCVTPTAQPTVLSIAATSGAAISGTFTAASPAADDYLVVRSTSATLSASPANGTTYTAGTALGGGTVVQASASTAIAQTGLTANTTYYYFVFSYSANCSGGPLYNTTAPLTGSAITCTAAPATLTGVGASTTTGTITFGTVTGATSYLLQYRVTGTTPWLTASPAPTASPYTLTGLAGSTTYDIQLSGPNATCGTFKTVTNAFTTQCTALNIPYTENFDGVTAPALPSCSSVEDVNADATTWATATTFPSSGANSLSYGYNSSNAANDWWYTPGLNLTAGSIYQVSFKYRIYSTFFPESMELKTGTAPASGSMGATALWSVTNDATNTTYKTIKVNYTATATGVQFFGFHANSAADEEGIFVDDVSIVVAPPAVGTISPTTFCAGTAVTVPFTAYTANTGNTYTAQLSDASGSFAAPVSIGTLSSAATGAGTISATIPATATGGIGYRIRVVSSNPALSGADNGTDLAINTLPTSVTAATSAATVCSGSSVNLTSGATFSSQLNFKEGFESGLPVTWTFINAGSGNSWIQGNSNGAHSGTYAMEYDYNSSNAANAWAITPGQLLTGGNTYTVSFYYITGGSAEKLQVTAGTTNTVAAQTTTLWSNNGGTSLNNTTYAQGTTTFTPATSGTYYFGFNCFSAKNKLYLDVDDISITGVVTSGTYAWASAPTGYTSTQQNPTGVVPSANTTYTVIATSAANCTNTATTSVAVNPLPTASISGTTSKCSGGTAASVTFTGAAGTAPYTFTYKLNGGSNLTVVSTGNTATVTAPTTGGTYAYTLQSVQDASSTACSQAQSGTATVTVYQTPSITSTSLNCNQITITSPAITGPGSIQYSFDGGSTYGASNTSGTLASGTTYTVMVNNSGMATCASAGTTVNTGVTGSTIAVSSGSGSDNGSCSLTDGGDYVTLRNASGNYIADVKDDANGTSLGSTPVTLTVDANAGTFPTGETYMRRHFVITPTSTTNNQADLKLYFTQADVDDMAAALGISSTNVLSGLTIARFDGGAQTPANYTSVISIAPSIVNYSNGIYSANFTTPGFSGFYPYYTLTTPLPVKLISLGATNEGTRNKIVWQSAEETNLVTYQVQRSKDGSTFDNLTEVPAAGKANSYSTYDAAPYTGTTYYRLRMIDSKGTTTISNIVSAIMKGADGFVLMAHPNPVSDVLTVDVSNAAGTAKVMLTDVTGKVMATTTVDNNTATFHMNGMAAGIYYIRYADDNHTQTIKVSKQ